jgi:hypothetical protein
MTATNDVWSLLTSGSKLDRDRGVTQVLREASTSKKIVLPKRHIYR